MNITHIYMFMYMLQVLNLGDVRNMSNVSIQAHTHTHTHTHTHHTHTTDTHIHTHTHTRKVSKVISRRDLLNGVKRDLLVSKETQ